MKIKGGESRGGWKEEDGSEMKGETMVGRGEGQEIRLLVIPHGSQLSNYIYIYIGLKPIKESY